MKIQRQPKRLHTPLVPLLVLLLVVSVLPVQQTVHAQTRDGSGTTGTGTGTGTGTSEPVEQALRRLVPGLTPAEVAELQSGTYIRMHTEDQPITFRYLPNTAISTPVRRSFDHVKPNVVNEVLYLLPRPTHRTADGTPITTDQELLLELYNTFRAVSKLSGITYISNRAGGPRVLFDNVYRIETLRRRSPLPDPVVTSIPVRDTFLLQLDDSNFGTSYFEAMFFGGRDAVSMGMTNARALTFIIPVIPAERVRFQLVAIPLEEHLLLYGAVALEAGSFLRRVVHLPSSFQRRINALSDWFIGEVYP